MESQAGSDTKARAAQLYAEQLLKQRSQLDKMFLVLMLVQWIFGVVVALLVSPFGWEGKEKVLHFHVHLALLFGGGITLLPVLLAKFRPGAALTRHTIAVTQILMAALLIHLTGGRIETHFMIFGSLAWLAFYLDWKVLVTATVAVAADHLLRGIFYPESVYGIPNPEWWRFLEHAFWVVFEDIILIVACQNGLKTLREGAERQTQLEELSASEQNKSAALGLAMTELKTAMARQGG